MLPKPDRFRQFIDRLAAAAPASSQEEAFALIAATLNAVEDEHSGVPANPANCQSDGRMYPPQADMARAAPGLPGVTVYRSRAHRTFIAENGAFVIKDVWTEQILVEKPGRNGVGISPFGNPGAP